MLNIFLAAPPPTWTYYTPLAGLIVSLLAVGFSVYSLTSNRSRSDNEVLEKRLHKLELDDANHGILVMNLQQHQERLADETERRCAGIERQLGEVSRLREDMASLKAEVKHIVEGFSRLEGKIDRLFELRK